VEGRSNSGLKDQNRRIDEYEKTYLIYLPFLRTDQGGKNNGTK
jgi:hypothetical protein